MKPFPEDHELISAFESEPEILDPDVPWYYNALTFRGEREGIRYRIQINPANGEIGIELSNSSQTISTLQIDGVTEMTAQYNKAESLLIASFDEDDQRRLLKIRLKPHIAIEWAG